MVEVTLWIMAFFQYDGMGDMVMYMFDQAGYGFYDTTLHLVLDIYNNDYSNIPTFISPVDAYNIDVKIDDGPTLNSR